MSATILQLEFTLVSWLTIHDIEASMYRCMYSSIDFAIINFKRESTILYRLFRLVEYIFDNHYALDYCKL